VPTPTPSEDQLTLAAYAADKWAERLRCLYNSWPMEPAPEKHWDLLIQIALGPRDQFELEKLRTDCPLANEPMPPPGGCSLSG
jgi:hypothetical protein